MGTIFLNGSGGPGVLLATVSPSGASDVDLTSISGDYRYLFIEADLKGSTTSQNLNVELNGDTTAGNYQYSLWGLSNGIGQQGEGQSKQIGIVAGSDYLTASYVYHRIKIPLYTSDAPKMVLSEVNGAVSSTNIVHYWLDVQWTGTAAVTSVRLFPAAGTVTGEVRLYGIP